MHTTIGSSLGGWQPAMAAQAAEAVAAIAEKMPG